MIITKPAIKTKKRLPAKAAAVMTTVIRDAPLGYQWGWHTREIPKMHLRSLNADHPYKIWLEDAGNRIFEPAGTIPPKVLNPLEEAMLGYRPLVETKWVRFMLDQHWLELHVALPHVMLVAYPRMPTEFARKIHLRTWLTSEQLATLTPEIITLDRDTAALRLWSNRTEEQVPYDVRLSTLLWQG